MPISIRKCSFLRTQITYDYEYIFCFSIKLPMLLPEALGILACNTKKACYLLPSLKKIKLHLTLCINITKYLFWQGD